MYQVHFADYENRVLIKLFSDIIHMIFTLMY